MKLNAVCCVEKDLKKGGVMLWCTYHHMLKSPENDTMPYAREAPDKEKTKHKYKDKIPQSI